MSLNIAQHCILRKLKTLAVCGLSINTSVIRAGLGLFWLTVPFHPSAFQVNPSLIISEIFWFSFSMVSITIMSTCRPSNPPSFKKVSVKQASPPTLPWQFGYLNQLVLMAIQYFLWGSNSNCYGFMPISPQFNLIVVYQVLQEKRDG